MPPFRSSLPAAPPNPIVIGSQARTITWRHSEDLDKRFQAHVYTENERRRELHKRCSLADPNVPIRPYRELSLNQRLTEIVEGVLALYAMQDRCRGDEPLEDPTPYIDALLYGAPLPKETCGVVCDADPDQNP